MTKLLSAGFARVRRDRLLWLCVAAVLFFSVTTMLAGIRISRAQASEIYYDMEHTYFDQAPMLGLFVAAFTPLFLGTEYSDGTLRNKLIVGHSRRDIYLSNLILSTFAALLMALAGLLGGLVGLSHFGGFAMGWLEYAVYVGVFLLSVVSLTAILTALQMSVSNKAASAVASLLLWLALLMLGSRLYNVLCEPAMVSEAVLTVDGVQFTDPHPNPKYVSGAVRQVYRLLLNLLPTGQQILISNNDLGDIALSLSAVDAVLSLVVTALSSLAGLLVFRKKDIK